LQEVMNAANALGARESELLGKKDAAGIAALFTSDGLLVSYAAIRKPLEMRLKAFMKGAGGVNACADRHAKYFGRGGR
jgi:hypothetical protein